MSESSNDAGETEQAGPSIDDDDDRHPRYPGRRRNGQCRKGFTPNRKGRPRRARSTRAVFQEMLQSKVPMIINGQLKRLTVVEAMAARVKREALTGPLRGLEKGVGVAQMYTLPELVEGETKINFDLLTEEEFETYGRLIYKLNGLSWDDRQAAPGSLSSPDPAADQPSD